MREEEEEQELTAILGGKLISVASGFDTIPGGKLAPIVSGLDGLGRRARSSL